MSVSISVEGICRTWTWWLKFIQEVLRKVPSRFLDTFRFCHTRLDGEDEMNARGHAVQINVRCELIISSTSLSCPVFILIGLIWTVLISFTSGKNVLPIEKQCGLHFFAPLNYSSGFKNLIFCPSFLSSLKWLTMVAQTVLPFAAAAAVRTFLFSILEKNANGFFA